MAFDILKFLEIQVFPTAPLICKECFLCDGDEWT